MAITAASTTASTTATATAPTHPSERSNNKQAQTQAATKMSSAEKIELDNTPVRERTRQQLRHCQQITRELFDAHGHLLNQKKIESNRESVANPNAKSAPVVLMDQLIEQQNVLRKLVDQVLEHQRLNGIIQQLRRANAVEDEKIAHLGTNLRSAESVLQNALDEARPRLAALRRANKRPVDVDEVISYGSKISASLVAPPTFDETNLASLGNHMPPAPTESMMRSGRLAELALADQLPHSNPS